MLNLRKFNIIFNLQIILFLLLSLLLFISPHVKPSNFVIGFFLIYNITLIIIKMILIDRPIRGLTLSIFTYLVLTQFGTFFIVHFLQIDYLRIGSYYNGGWLFSNNYYKAILLGSIAMNSLMLLSNRIFSHNKQMDFNYYPQTRKTFYLVGLLTLFISNLYLIGNVMLRNITLSGTYRDFLSFSAGNNIYSFFIFIIPLGFLFSFSVIKKKIEFIFIILLYLPIATILLLTGNKGEILYTVIVAIGLHFFKENKVNIRLILLGLLILFILVPTITTLRNIGVANNISDLIFSFSNPLIETGFQLRLSVFIIDEFANGTRELIYGFSYYNPFINIINRILPFIPRLYEPLYFNFYTKYDTMGFSSVAESYANFGLLGVIFFHAVLGYFLKHMESVSKSDFRLPLYAGFLVIFVNMIRNVFAFVPGQMLMTTLIWYSVILFGKLRFKNVYKPVFAISHQGEKL